MKRYGVSQRREDAAQIKIDKRGSLWKKIILLCAALGALGVVSLFLLNGIMIRHVRDQFLDVEATVGEGSDKAKADCILVLGAGVNAQGEPSMVLKARLDQAIELYRAGVSDRLLMSGDHGREDYDEVKTMKKYAIEAGVPSDHVFMDHAGFSTYESVYRARDVFQVKSMVVVTQKYHTYRALYIADKLGVKAYGAPAKMPVYRGNWVLEAREKLARAKEFFEVMIQPKPTYLGDVISIFGNGNVTNDRVEELEF